jgi:hypothetical protein
LFLHEFKADLYEHYSNNQTATKISPANQKNQKNNAKSHQDGLYTQAMLMENP